MEWWLFVCLFIFYINILFELRYEIGIVWLWICLRKGNWNVSYLEIQYEIMYNGAGGQRVSKSGDIMIVYLILSQPMAHRR